VTGSRGNGTGFAFLSPRWIVTAKHVVTADPPTLPRAVFTQGRPYSARLLFADPRVDLAVLELLGEPPCRRPLMPADRTSEAAGLMCVGYKPSLGDRARGRYTTVVSHAAWHERSRRQRDGYEEDLFIFPAPDGEPGHSGGPVLTPDGAVVAVIADGITLAGQRLLRATSIGPLRDQLAQRQ
ncbi:MAG TPA: serine protease, partial [Vicinamibacteria bacterium]